MEVEEPPVPVQASTEKAAVTTKTVRNEDGNGAYLNPPSLSQLPTTMGLGGFIKGAFGKVDEGRVVAEERYVSPELEKEIPKDRDFVMPIKAVDLDMIKSPPAKDVQATWIGHSSWLVQSPTHNILMDAIFSDKCSPLSWIGPHRLQPPAILIEDLPPIHVISISHNHYDHLDLPSLKSIYKSDKHSPIFVVPHGIKPLLVGEGVADGDVIELNWWDSHIVNGNDDLNLNSNQLKVTCVPAKHFSSRGLFDRDKTLWCGFVFEFGSVKVFHAGDTAYHDVIFREIGDVLGPIDMSLIPIGAYRPAAMMRGVHIDPWEAVQIHIDVKSRKTIGMHWGTFVLSREPLGEPMVAVKDALLKEGLESDAFVTVSIGETVLV